MISQLPRTLFFSTQCSPFHHIFPGKPHTAVRNLCAHRATSCSDHCLVNPHATPKKKWTNVRTYILSAALVINQDRRPQPRGTIVIERNARAPITTFPTDIFRVQERQGRSACMVKVQNTLTSISTWSRVCRLVYDVAVRHAAKPFPPRWSIQD